MAIYSTDRNPLTSVEEVPLVGFQTTPGNPANYQTVLDLRRPSPLELATGQPGATVMVVSEQHLPVIRQAVPCIVDRGEKHKGKQLSRYFLPLNGDKIPLLDGGYASLAQLRRSIRDFLAKLGPITGKPIFILGVPHHLFKDLQRVIQSEQNDAIQNPTVISTFPTESCTDSNSLLSWLDNRLNSRTPIPAELIEQYVGISPDAQLVRRLIMMAAGTDEPILILGDTGTGKEVVARAIHLFSSRATEQLITVNCGAIPSELLEAELFGYVKGAFTGACSNRKGRWQAADRGTLFLDEIGDLRKDHQVKILRALENGTVQRLGDNKDRTIQVRVVAATNRDLYAMVQNGEFREDLYYRLRSFLIPTTPLRNHPEDIPLLANKIWKRITKNSASFLPVDVLEVLQKHQWPGNVRELKTVLAGLHAVFGAQGIQARDVAFVFMLQGHIATHCTSLEKNSDILVHRTRCLNHLKRVHEAVSACRHILTPVFNGTYRDLNQQHQETLRRLIAELNRLCLDPLLFHREDIFTETNELKEKLIFGLEPGAVKKQALWRQWCTTCNDLIASTISKLFSEIEIIVSQS